MNRRPIRPGHSIRTALASTILALSALQIVAFGQAFTFTLGDLTYDEDFDSMGATGTEFVPGWTSTDSTMVAGTGSNNAGGIYNVGSAGSGERAFGSIASGSNIPFFGASFLNSTGSQIVTLELTAFMEMWRSGSSSIIESQTFEFSLDATSLFDGTWTPVSSMNLVEPATAPNDNVAKDGNLPENRAAVSSGGSPVPVSWADSTSLWIRWKDNNDAGSDALIAVDDFSMTVTLGLPPKDLLWTPTTAIWDSVETNWKDTSNNNIVAFATGDTVTFDSTGLAQSNVQVAAGGVSPSTMTVNVGALETYRISGGAIGTNTPLEKQGVGTLELGSVYSGGLNAAAGTVRTLVNEVFGDSSPVTLGNNATFDLNHHDETIGALDLTGATITTGAGIITVTGNITVQDSPTNTPSTINDAISVGTGIRNLTVVDSMAAEDLIINAAIIGSARIAFAGPGTVRLNGDNSAYSGNFQLNNGTVIVGSADTPFGTNQIFWNGGIIHAAVPLTGDDKLVNGISLGGTGATIEGEDVEVGGEFVLFHLNQPTAKTLRIDGDTVVTLSGGLADGIANPPAGASLSIAGTGTAIVNGDTSNYTLAFQVGDFSTPRAKVILDTPTGLGNSVVTLYAFEPLEPVELIIAQSAPIGGLNSNGDDGVVTLGDGVPGIDPVILTLTPAIEAAFYTGTIETAPGFSGGVVMDGAAAQTLSGSLLFDTLTVLNGTLILNSPLEDADITNTSGTLYLLANADGSTLNADSPAGTHILEDQSLVAVNIGADGRVVLGGTPPPPSPAAGLQAVPEPGAFALLLAGTVGMLGRRRKVARDCIP